MNQKVFSKTTTETTFKISFWNAGDLTYDKFTELKTIILNNDLDVMGIVESGAAADNEKYFNIPGYQKFELNRSRQIASGIIVFVKLAFKAKLSDYRQMTTEDKLEFVEMHIWRQETLLKTFFLCNPPNNKPNFERIMLNWDNRSLTLGDFNAHSTRWGYPTMNGAGGIVEVLIDSNPIHFIDNQDNSPTFLAFNGSVSHPVLSLVHPDLSDRIYHELIDSPGGAGHKILMTGIERSLHTENLAGCFGILRS